METITWRRLATHTNGRVTRNRRRSFASMFFFKEPLAGRGFPIAAIVAGVVALCL